MATIHQTTTQRKGLLARITVFIPEGAGSDLPTSELVLDNIVEAINRCGQWELWAPEGTHVEGVEIAAQKLTETQTA